MSVITLTGSLPTLIDSSRATTNAQLAPLAASNPALLNNLVKAASDAVRRHCRRNFSAAAYVGYFDGGGYPFDTLFLPDPPILSVSRLATNPQTVLTVQNANAAMNQRATVAVAATGVTLYRMASGVASTDTSATFAAYPTVSAIAAYINTLGNGWVATPVTGYELYPSADFKVTTGAMSAAGSGCELQQHLEAPNYAGSGMFFDGTAAWTAGGGWRMDEAKGVIWGQFTPGPLAIRCDFVAGFATIPDAVQEATVLTAVGIYRSGMVNPSFSSVRLGDAGMTLATKTTAIPPAARELLSEYVDWAGSRV